MPPRAHARRLRHRCYERYAAALRDIDGASVMSIRELTHADARPSNIYRQAMRALYRRAPSDITQSDDARVARWRSGEARYAASC